MPEAPEQERYRPMALIGVVVIALLGFAVFFLSFLVAPLAILAIFYIGFVASDRSKRGSSAPPPALTHEAIARTDEIGRQDEAAGPTTTYASRPVHKPPTT